jgi:hypothetical protein
MTFATPFSGRVAKTMDCLRLVNGPLVVNGLNRASAWQTSEEAKKFEMEKF